MCDDWNYQEFYKNLLMPIGCRGFSLNYPTQLNLFCLDVVDNSGCVLHHSNTGGHGGRVVTLSPHTSEARVRFTALPQVGKLVVACRWLTVYSTEP